MSAVEFVIALKDKASSTIDKIGKEFGIAKTNSDRLGTSMQNVSNKGIGLGRIFGSLSSILTTFGIGFGLYKVGEMMREGTEKAHELRLAQVQVTTSLESTGHAAGIMYEDTLKQAKKLSSATLFGRTQITDMQSMLLTFPSVSKKIFESASGAILDISTKMHQDVKMSTVMVGKALQDPAYGVMALRRVGVNLTKEQANIIKGLVASGHKDIAQAMILKELNTEFGGSAKAAFDATPLAKYNKLVDSIKIGLGELVEKLQEKLAPTLEYIAQKAKSSYGFIKNWIDLFRDGNPWVVGLTTVLFSLTAAIAAYNIVSGIMIARTALMTWYNGLSTAAIIVNTLATEGWAAAWVAVDIAMDANPVGLIIAGIVALVAIVVVCYQKFGWFRGAVLASWEAIKGFGNLIMNFLVDSITGFIRGLGGIADALLKLFSGDFKGALAVGKQAVSDLLFLNATDNAIKTAKETGKNIGAAYNKGVAEVEANKKKAASKESKIIPGTNVAYGMNGGSNGKLNNKGTTQSVASGGTRNTSITIHLGKMVENIIFQGGIKENTEDMIRQVEEALVRTLAAAQSAS